MTPAAPISPIIPNHKVSPRTMTGLRPANMRPLPSRAFVLGYGLALLIGVAFWAGVVGVIWEVVS